MEVLKYRTMKVLACGFFAGALLSLSGCGIQIGGGGTGETSTPAKETVFGIDGIKLIAKDISRGDDERTYGQRSFVLSPSARLLVRYENLIAARTNVREDYPLRLRVFAASDADAVVGKASLKVCPLNQSWMMLASWSAAHPWRGGEWEPGGSYDESACVAVEIQSPPVPADASTRSPGASPTPKPAFAMTGTVKAAISAQCSEARALCFDITNWYKTFVVEQNMNFGLILIAEQPVSIIGDGSPGKAPRIHWFETPKVW